MPCPSSSSRALAGRVAVLPALPVSIARKRVLAVSRNTRDVAQFADVLATVLRILAGLAWAFVIGCILAILMARSRRMDEFLAPVLTLFQGIPGAFLGGVRHHLVSRHRDPHPVHHGDDDVTGVRVSGARRPQGHVQRSRRDGDALPAARRTSCCA